VLEVNYLYRKTRSRAHEVRTILSTIGHNKFLETMGHTPDASRAVAKSVSNISQPPNRTRGRPIMRWSIFGVTGRPRRVMLQSNIVFAIPFCQMKIRRSGFAPSFVERETLFTTDSFLEVPLPRPVSLPRDGPYKRADIRRNKSGTSFASRAVCSISILRVAVVFAHGPVTLNNRGALARTAR